MHSSNMPPTAPATHPIARSWLRSNFDGATACAFGAIAIGGAFVVVAGFGEIVTIATHLVVAAKRVPPRKASRKPGR